MRPKRKSPFVPATIYKDGHSSRARSFSFTVFRSQQVFRRESYFVESLSSSLLLNIYQVIRYSFVGYSLIQYSRFIIHRLFI